MRALLQDVSMCVPTAHLDHFAAVEVDKVLGAWSVGLTNPPTDGQIMNAAIAGFGMPAHFIETVCLHD